MENVYTNGKVNLLSIILAWSAVIIIVIIQYLFRSTLKQCLVFLATSCIYIIPIFVYIHNKHSKLIRYFIIFGTMLLVYITLFLQNGAFDDTYYLLVTIALTAMYFDIRLTIYTTILNIIFSVACYCSLKTFLFPDFRIDNFVSLQFCFILTGATISIQTYLSKKLLESYQGLYEKAIRDKLTNLYNRTYFDEFFINTVDNYKLQNKELSIIFLDIDNFKGINDNFGHAKGDMVIKAVSERICLACRDKDVAARIGGDEFIMLLLDKNKHEALGIAEEVIMEINKIESIAVTVSLGVTSLIINDTKEDVFNRADKALYMAKDSGKNRYFVL